MTCLFNISENPVRQCSIITDTEFGIARTITMRLSYPRFILPQMAKHRVFAQTTRSSRYSDYDVEYYKNQSISFQDFESLLASTLDMIDKLKSEGVTKEIYNRFLEPYAFTDQILTMDWRDLDHFLRLRLADDAQWEIRELATAIMLAVNDSKPIHSNIHIPFADYSCHITIDTIQMSVSKVGRISRKSTNETFLADFIDRKRFERMMSNKHFSVLEHIRYEGENVRFLGEKQSNKKHDRENDVNEKVFESIFNDMVKNAKVWR